MTSSPDFLNSNLNDIAKCPLCGAPNQCAMAADPDASECWCESVKFPKELLDKIPEDAVRKTCVCQNCLDEYQQTAPKPCEDL